MRTQCQWFSVPGLYVYKIPANLQNGPANDGVVRKQPFSVSRMNDCPQVLPTYESLHRLDIWIYRMPQIVIERKLQPDSRIKKASENHTNG